MSDKTDKLIEKIRFYLWDDRFKSESDLDVSRKLMMLNYIILATVFFLVPYGILSLINKNYLISIFDITTSILVFVAVYHYKKTQKL